MPSCVFRKCKNYGFKINKSEGISYHTFPVDDFTKHKWVSIVRAERSEHDWMPTKSSTICSAHFKQEDIYTTSKGYLRLKKTAVPVIVSNNDDVPKSGSTTSLDHKMDNLTRSIADDQSNASIKKEPEVEESVPMIDPEDVIVPGTSNAREHFSGGEYEVSLECELAKPLGYNEFAKKRKLDELHNESLAVTLRDINTQLHVLTNQREDCFDSFGKYVSSMLRSMPMQKALELQPKIVALITSVVVSKNEDRISQSHENCS